MINKSSFIYIMAAIFSIRLVFAEALPVAGVDRVTEMKSMSISRREAFSDQPLSRLHARLALARAEFSEKRFSPSLKWVEEYGEPVPENLAWPTVQGFVEAAQARAALGQMFDAVQRLNIAKDKSEGLGRVMALHSLSELIEKQPNLQKALELEKQALADGDRHFHRRRISESAGLEEAKAGHEIWVVWKPLIGQRIVELQKLVDIEAHGLDFVLYRIAQNLRKAEHPLALDFTHVEAAFGLKSRDVNVPNADFEAARAQYLEITELFPQGVYSDASHLYAAVCLAHMGQVDEAIKELSAFYKRNPEGLYRGEALNIMGNLFLTAKWDRRNAKEAYKRAAAWTESVRVNDRVLDTYVIPEKSAEITRPPRQPRQMGEKGEILREEMPATLLVNRLTAEWYLNQLRSDVEWKLGLLEFLEGNQKASEEHYAQALAHDRLLQQAQAGGEFNTYQRMMMVYEQKALIMTPEEMRGLSDKVALAMSWADFHFIQENFRESGALYRRIQSAARSVGDGNALVRAAVGETLMKKAAKIERNQEECDRLFNLVIEFPKAPASPYLLMECAYMGKNKPIPSKDMMWKVYADYPKSWLAASVRYNYILRYVDSENEKERHDAIRAFVRDFPGRMDYFARLAKHENHMLARPVMNKLAEEARAKSPDGNLSFEFEVPEVVTAEDISRF